MFVNQLSVFIENREGRLDKVLATLKDNDINIVSLSLADTSDYGLLRMIVSDPEKGKTALKEAGFTMAFAGNYGDGLVKVGMDKFRLPRYVITTSTTIWGLDNYFNRIKS